MQPGDNFVIAASTDENYLNSVGINGTGLQDSSGNQITNTSARARRTDMLSVWRRLHIEVDSMGASDGNFVLGTIPNGRVIYSRRQATLDISPSPFQLLEENRFENGRLVVGGSFDLDVVSNTATTITVVNNSGTARVISSNSQFTLYDDDDYNDDDGATGDGTLDGDTGENIPEPDMSLLTANSDNAATNILAPMYIHPAYDVVDPSDNNFFLSNAYSDSAADTRRLFVDRDLTTTNTDPGFWTVYILGSYQHTIPEDNDPAATELPTFGIADGIPLTILGDGSGALIHLEVHNSKEIIDYPATDPSLRRVATTVGHELGHLLAGRHGDGDIMTDQVGNLTSNQFNPTTIRRVRAQLTHP
jgi:hypothetical protein